MSVDDNNERKRIRNICPGKCGVVKSKNIDLLKNPAKIIRSDEIEDSDASWFNQCCQSRTFQVLTGRTVSHDYSTKNAAPIVGYTCHGSHYSADGFSQQSSTEGSSSDCSSYFSVGEQFKVPDYCMESVEQSKVEEVFAEKRKKIREEMKRVLQESRLNSDQMNNYQIQRQAAYLERCELQKEAYNICKRVQRAEVGFFGIKASFTSGSHIDQFCCAAKMAHINHYQHRLDQVRMEVAKMDCDLGVREAANERLSLKNDEIKSDIRQMLGIIQDLESELVFIQKELTGKTNQDPQGPENSWSLPPIKPKPPISDQPNGSPKRKPPPFHEKPETEPPRKPGSHSEEHIKPEPPEESDRPTSDKTEGSAPEKPEQNSPEGHIPHSPHIPNNRIPWIPETPGLPQPDVRPPRKPELPIPSKPEQHPPVGKIPQVPQIPGKRIPSVPETPGLPQTDVQPPEKPELPTPSKPGQQTPGGQTPHGPQMPDKQIPSNPEMPDLPHLETQPSEKPDLPVSMEPKTLDPKAPETNPENPGNYAPPKPTYPPVSEVPKPPVPVYPPPPLYPPAPGNSSQYKHASNNEGASYPPTSSPPYCPPYWPYYCHPYFLPFCLPPCPPPPSTQSSSEPPHTALTPTKKSSRSEVRSQRTPQSPNRAKAQIKSQPAFKKPNSHECPRSSKLDKSSSKKGASPFDIESVSVGGSPNASETSFSKTPQTQDKPPKTGRNISSGIDLDPLKDISIESLASITVSESSSESIPGKTKKPVGPHPQSSPNKSYNRPEALNGKITRRNAQKTSSVSTSQTGTEANDREENDFSLGSSQNHRKDGPGDDDRGRGRGGGGSCGANHSDGRDINGGNNQSYRKSCNGRSSCNCRHNKDRRGENIHDEICEHICNNCGNIMTPEQIEARRKLANILKSVDRFDKPHTCKCPSANEKRFSRKCMPDQNIHQTSSHVTYMSLTLSSSRKSLSSKCSLSETVHKVSYDSSNFSDEKSASQSEDRSLSFRTSTHHVKSRVYEMKASPSSDTSSKKLQNHIDQLAVAVKLKDKKLEQFERHNQQLLTENAKLSDLMEEVSSLKKENATLTLQIKQNKFNLGSGVVLAQEESIWKQSSHRCFKRTAKLEKLLLNVSKQSQNNLRDYMTMSNLAQSYQQKLNQCVQGIFKRTPDLYLPRPPVEKSNKFDWIRYCKEILVFARKLDEKSNRQKRVLGIINTENDELLQRNEELVKKLQMYAETEESYIRNNFGSPLKSELDCLRKELEKYQRLTKQQNVKFETQNELKKQIDKLSKELQLSQAKLAARKTELETLNYRSVDEISKIKKENSILVETLETERDEVRKLSNQLLITKNILEEHKQEVEKLRLNLAVGRKMCSNKIENHVNASIGEVSTDPLLLSSSGLTLKTLNSQPYCMPLRQSTCPHCSSKPVDCIQCGNTQNLHLLYQSVQRAVEGAICNITLQQRDNIGIHNELRKLNRSIAQLKSRSIFMARGLLSQHMGSENSRQKDPKLHRICSQIITEGISTLEFRELIYLHYAVYNAGVEIQMNAKIRTKFSNSLGIKTPSKMGNRPEMVKWDVLQQNMSTTEDIRNFRDKPKNW